MFEIQIEPREEYTVFRPVGELDSASISKFRKALHDNANRGRLVIDLSSLRRVDTLALAALAGGVRLIRERGGQAAISCGESRVLTLLNSTGLDRVVPHAQTIREAVGFWRANGPSELGPPDELRSAKRSR